MPRSRALLRANGIPDQPPTRGELDDILTNYLLARKFGSGFAEKFGTAHEGVPGNEADREAMDLYNNEVGRRIAADHPDADPEELADLVRQAVERGDVVVIDRNRELARSNRVPVGGHAQADDPPHPGRRPAEPEDSRTGS